SPMDCFSLPCGRRDRAADERERMAGDRLLHAAPSTGTSTGAATAPPPAAGAAPRATGTAAPPPHARGRDAVIDGLRGLMVLVMAVDHFGGPLTRFTFQPFGFASAAEGFVFLAGLVSGLVYTRFLEAPGHTLERRAFARAGKVYEYHVAAVVLLLAIGLCSVRYADYYARRELASQSPLATLGYALLLVNQPRLLD